MNKLISAIRACRRGATALEFALITPALVALTFGGVEVGLVVFDLHRYGHGARAAARTAAIQPPIASLSNLAMTPVVCSSGGCTGGASNHPASFTAIVAAARAVVPELTDSQIRVTYRESGVMTGVPAGAAVTPAITVEFIGAQRESFFLNQFLHTGHPIFTYPTFASTAIGATIVN